MVNNASSSNNLVAIASQAVASSDILALPHLYDVASRMIFDQCRMLSDQKNQALVQVVDKKYQTLTQRNLANDVKVAFHHVAPIGLNIVRVAALGSFLVSANPVGLVLGGAGVFLTGKKAVEDIKRALFSDPEIRRHLQAAEDALAQGDMLKAEQCLKDALTVDVSPDNPRNGDIYLQFGMLYFRMQKPRQALIAFTKASVLFRENQFLLLPTKDGQRDIKVSKRGYTELMILNCLNAFALDETGLSEWATIAKDTGQSTLIRLENFARSQDDGIFFSLFGVDAESARYNRYLMGGVKFLQAKFATIQAIERVGVEQLTPAIDAGLAMVLEDENLDNNEKGQLIIQQSQFYFTMALRYPAIAVKCIDVALELSSKGGALLNSPSQQLVLRAEVMSWLIHNLPSFSQQHAESIALRLPTYRAEWLDLLDHVEASTMPGRKDFMLWSCDQLYRSATSQQERKAAVEKAISIAQVLQDDASSVHYALRLVFVDPSHDSVEKLLQATACLSNNSDPIMRTYGLRYQAKLNEERDIVVAREFFKKAAVTAQDFCKTLTSKHHHIPFMLQGRTVIHTAQQARVILEVHAAYCLYKADMTNELEVCLGRLERDADVIDQPMAVLVLDSLRARQVYKKGDHSYALHLRKKVLDSAPADIHPELHCLLHDIDIITPTPVETLAISEAVLEKTHDHLDHFDLMRARILQIVNYLEHLLVSSSYGEATLQIVREQREHLNSLRFCVAIVGEFSTGKSTFLNALLGARILPSAVRPTTAIVNRLSYGSPGLTIHYQDGREEKIALDLLKDFITEKANPSNEKKVKSVDIYSLAPLLRTGITLIDTPGVGSLFSNHTDITLQMMPSCDAVVLVTDATQPLAKSERQFLERLKEVMKERIFVVANKVDDLTPPQVARSISFLEENIRSLLPTAKVYPVSAYLALSARRLITGELTVEDIADDPFLHGATDHTQLLNASRILDLEDGLYNDLVSQKGRLLVETVKDRLMEVLDEVEDDLKLRTRNLDRDLNEVNIKVEAVVAASRSARQQLSRLFEQLNEDREFLKSEQWDQVRTQKQTIMKSITDRVAALSLEQLQENQILSQLDNHVNDWLKDNFQQSALQYHKHINSAAKSVADISSRLGSAFIHHFEMGDISWKNPVQLAIVSYTPPENNNEEAFLISGGLGFLGGFLLGPVGVMAAVMGGVFLDMINSDRQSALAKEQLMDKVRSHIDMAEELFRDKVMSVLDASFNANVAKLRHDAERGINIMDERLAAMMAERQQALDDLIPTHHKLGNLMAEISSLRATLEGATDEP